MTRPQRTIHRIRFGNFVFDLRLGELLKAGRRVKLQGQPIQILSVLLERRGDLVTREELQRRLWPADTFVDFEHSLNAAVKRLRQALDDSAEQPRFVETLARRGYRFIAPVEVEGDGDEGGLASQAAAIRSLAVLPFENVGGDPGTEYVSDGLTECLINNLSQLSAVRVIARSTVFRYKSKEIDTRAVGRALGVESLLLGSVRQRDDSLLISVELVDAENGWQLWGGQYSRRLSDILGLQSEISRQITERLRLHLTGDDEARLAKCHTKSCDAYRDYLQGRYHWNKMTADSLHKSIYYFRQAIEKDADYALAHAGLADTYSLCGFYGLMPPREVMPKAKAAALRAVELDDNLAEAHAALAGVKKNYDWDWAAAEREYRRALELNPRYATAHRVYADYLLATGRPREAMEEIELAQDQDPLSLVICVEAAWNSYMAREYERSIGQSLRTLEMEPMFHPANYTLGLAYEQQGRFDEAVTAFELARDGSSGNPATLAALGHVFALTGREQEARQILARLNAMSARAYISPFWQAIVCAGLNEADAALGWLERACAERDVWLVWLKVDPRLDLLRSDARFGDLLCRVFPNDCPALPVPQAPGGSGEFCDWI
jgi:TolB-like protein/Flp pilus assembly protein TadD